MLMLAFLITTLMASVAGAAYLVADFTWCSRVASTQRELDKIRQLLEVSNKCLDAAESLLRTLEQNGDLHPDHYELVADLLFKRS